MSETELMRTEIARVMSRAHPPVVMSLADVADFIGMSYTYVKDVIQNDPEFPRRLDRFKQPRYSRESVLKWAQISA